MRRLIAICLTVLVSFVISDLVLNPLPASAVRNGQETQIGKFAVAIASSQGSCSGVAITTRVVITAAHCVVKGSTSITDIKVGPTGANQHLPGGWINVIEVLVEPGFFSDDSKTVPKNDIAFLILASDRFAVSITRVATEEDLAKMRGKGEVLMLQGYGRTEEGKEPSSFASFPRNGFFALEDRTLFDSTLHSISSRTYSACNGDSGAPVVFEDGKDTILLGVNVGGGGTDNNCRQLSADNLFRTEVQMPSRHLSILVNSIVKTSSTVGVFLQNALEEKAKEKKDLTELQTQLISIQSELDSTNATLSRFRIMENALKTENSILISSKQALTVEVQSLSEALQSLKNEVQILTKYATTTITCVKGKTTMKVKGIGPNCPTGYKKK